MRANGVSYTGYKRKINQDRYLIRDLSDGLLLAVADGMGGENGGEVAAQLAMDTLSEARLDVDLDQGLLAGVLLQASQLIQEQARQDPALEGMGTTVTVAAIVGDTAYWAHVGDSRLYLFRKGNFSRISTDHTFVQDLIEDGTLSPEEAARHPLSNMLDQCVGCPRAEPDQGSFRMLAGDRLLLCTDGLSRYVSEEQIKNSLADDDPEEAVKKLAGLALGAGGKDNITVLIMKMQDTIPSGA